MEELKKHKWLTGDANSDLRSVIPRLQEYNGMRKFRQAVFGIQIARYLTTKAKPDEQDELLMDDEAKSKAQPEALAATPGEIGKTEGEPE